MQPTLHDGQWCLFAKGFSADPSSDTAVEAVLLEPLPTLAGSRGRAKA